MKREPIARSIEQYKNHPSIVAIKSKSTNKYFKFNSISKTEIETKISNTDSSKAFQDSNIPTRVIKSNSDIFTDALYSKFNRSLETSVFPSSMKLGNATPVNRKVTIGQLAYYLILKVFGRCIYNQIAHFFDKILFKHQCCFRQGHNSHHCLIVLLGKLNETIGQGNVFRALLTDFSKAFGCLPYNLLIEKLNAYGFERIWFGQ